MRRASHRAGAGLALASALLPLCVFASPLRLQVSRCDSTITDVPELSSRALEERTTYGLTQALRLEQGKATLVSAGAPDGADLLVAAKLGRNGAQYRLVYVLQTQQEPKLSRQLSYEFSNPRLGDRGVSVMAQEIIAEAAKLEQSRKSLASRPVPELSRPAAPVDEQPRRVSNTASTEVARAPAPALPRPDEAVRSPAASEAPSEPVANVSPRDTSIDTFEVRKQPLVVIHTGLAGLYGPGSRNFGFGAVVEPKWNITDSIAAGLRFDGGIMFGGGIESRLDGGTGVPSSSVSFSSSASVATLLKGEYLLGRSGVRPFLGLGAGMYSLAGQSVATSADGAGVNQTAGQFFGLAPQLGIDFGGARLGLTYNHILGGDIVVEQNINAGIEAERIERNYLQLELTFRIKVVSPPRSAGRGRY
ncbi:hypothetical protein ACLESO_05100 [Pyxidicoccus sp. 3LG]